MYRGWRSSPNIQKIWKEATLRSFRLKGNKTLVSNLTTAFQSDFITQVTWTSQCLSLDPQSLLNNEGFTQGISSFLFSSACLWLQYSWHKSTFSQFSVVFSLIPDIVFGSTSCTSAVPLHVLGLVRAPHGVCGTVIGRPCLVLAWRIPFLSPHWFTLVARHLRWWEYLIPQKLANTTIQESPRAR